jgi:hypothetical protein
MLKQLFYKHISTSISTLKIHYIAFMQHLQKPASGPYNESAEPNPLFTEVFFML